MFGFKPMITGSPVMISYNELEPMRFDSMSKASLKHFMDWLQSVKC